MDEREIRELSIDTIRGLAMDSVQKANAGHPGTAMALAPLAYTLFERFLEANPNDTEWPDRDRFVLSSGHACVLQYSLLHLCGYDLTLDDLKQFRQWGSRTPGHPERGHTAGIEVTTGALRWGGRRHRRRPRARRALPRGALQPSGPRARRPPYVRDLLRRRPDGGDQPGS